MLKPFRMHLTLKVCLNTVSYIYRLILSFCQIYLKHLELYGNVWFRSSMALYHAMIYMERYVKIYKNKIRFIRQCGENDY